MENTKTEKALTMTTEQTMASTMTKTKTNKATTKKLKKAKTSICLVYEAAGFDGKDIGTRKDKVKHSDKDKDKKTNGHLSASCMR